MPSMKNARRSEAVKRFRVGQRIDVFDLAPMDDITHGELNDFAGFSARNIGDLKDARRHMPRRAIGENARPNSVG